MIKLIENNGIKGIWWAYMKIKNKINFKIRKIFPNIF